MSFKEVVSRQRSIAHAMPCEHAMQCLDDRYFFGVNPAQGVSVVVGLTVNVGQE